MKVTIVDYGAGNVPSVERALQRLGAESERTSSPERILKAEALLLPGVLVAVGLAWGRRRRRRVT